MNVTLLSAVSPSSHVAAHQGQVRTRRASTSKSGRWLYHWVWLPFVTSVSDNAGWQVIFLPLHLPGDCYPALLGCIHALRYIVVNGFPPLVSQKNLRHWLCHDRIFYIKFSWVQVVLGIKAGIKVGRWPMTLGHWYYTANTQIERLRIKFSTAWPRSCYGRHGPSEDLQACRVITPITSHQRQGIIGER